MICDLHLLKMALIKSFPKTNANVMKQLLCISIQLLHKGTIYKSEVDTIDDFTTELLRKKESKWKAYRLINKQEEKNNVSSILQKNCTKNTLSRSQVNVQKYSKKEIDHLMTSLLDEHRFKEVAALVKQCISYNICPCLDILVRFLAHSARNGDCDSVRLIQELLKQCDLREYTRRGELKQYLAQSIWVQGNINESLQLFEEIYKHDFLRRSINYMLKYLLYNITNEKSEATLVNVVNFATKIALNHREYIVLFYVWQVCFLSEWYADQCRAQEILDQHPRVIRIVANRVYNIANKAARNHKPETIHKLLELLLKYNVEVNYSNILGTLFEYRYSQNDIRSCGEIIKWAAENNVALSSTIEEKFIKLLTREPFHNPKSVPAENFKLKF